MAEATAEAGAAEALEEEGEATAVEVEEEATGGGNFFLLSTSCFLPFFFSVHYP